MILSLEYRHSPARYLASRTVTATKAGSRLAGMVAGNMSPLRLINLAAPVPPDEGWTRVAPRLSGICGSDLGLLMGRSSPYFSSLSSTPFVPGHEVVGETLDELPDLPAGSRVVLDPVLSCEPRAIEACQWCASNRESRCDHVTTGAISPGVQTGSCAETGGGWSRQFVAHRSQLHPVPDSLDDERAVLVEPLACAVHAARRVPVPTGASVVVIGAGTVGLMTLLALREIAPTSPIHVVAKHGHQQERALALGATAVHEPSRAARALRRSTKARMHSPEWGAEFLLGGVDVVFECTGGAAGLDTALRLTRAGGTVVVSGMPSGNVDLAPLWFRELQLVGAYASDSGGPDEVARRSDFDEAIELAGAAPLDGWVEPPYPLRRWREALSHAVDAGKLGSVKIAFAPGKD
ncbi:threonine dehydrogenase-like Zn-dependent dehydrogenase [Haloactinopolyspora alba]|uniref:Threonine dehydrogenase-like Zn-dependent dehydrogenase n=1 Tax=Haloactinopolyspora alba TaxID=648780 RepID=A0A2P8DFR6_9ACTN|nr:zinc-binding dehydrogenase [Haloactinopolyspora alba]PSK96062.1 threonine dehydrogenase-like Zn-dependent dehydrogenase [Haloactinopolyspora alba]